jgi:hypothetical protein
MSRPRALEFRGDSVNVRRAGRITLTAEEGTAKSSPLIPRRSRD